VGLPCTPARPAGVSCLCTSTCRMMMSCIQIIQHPLPPSIRSLCPVWNSSSCELLHWYMPRHHRLCSIRRKSRIVRCHHADIYNTERTCFYSVMTVSPTTSRTSGSMCARNSAVQSPCVALVLGARGMQYQRNHYISSCGLSRYIYNARVLM
jgi:hypothetical protein